ncbi:TcfC E-set like domain-containing protein [uncultured Umboniibacter sp.]|uniref:TcfC E-set like domain-containing protein n=1 Tax=uncultured Umboniibacter sp. TaxID=1798917 RepID=UPI00262DEB05|nr:TcfC E-set like domain-containing protein [uncultured Umboniibacter sp.]
MSRAIILACCSLLCINLFAQSGDDYITSSPSGDYVNEQTSRVQFFCSLQREVVEVQRDNMAERYGWHLDIASESPLRCLRTAAAPSTIAYNWLERARRFGFDDAEILSQDSDSAPIQATAWVPPGFESLLEPQITRADVFFGGRRIGAYMIIFTPDRVEFQDPSLIVERLPDLLEPARVTQSLTGALDPNSVFACGSRSTIGCGELKATPLVAGVIFDESRFRVDVFINPEQLAVRSAGVQKYLPPSSAKGSMMQSLYLATSGNIDDPAAVYSVAGTNTAAWRENRLVTDFNYANDELNIDEFALQRDYEGLSYRAGYFNTDSSLLSFGYGGSMRGVSMGTSIDTRTDLRQSAGNEVTVFLSSRSRVAIYKDGRLISAQNYDAGNQIVDTTALPGGSYDIDIEITDSSGRSTIETRFYVKSSRLPPKDEAEWYFELGEATEITEDRVLRQPDEDWIVRAGYSRRITDTIGVGGGLAAHNYETMAEFDLFNIGRYHELQTSIAYSDNDAYGVNVNSNFNLNRWSMAANIRYIENPHFDDNINPNLTRSLLGNSLTQGSLSIQRSTDFGYFALQARYNERFAQDELKTYTFRYTAPAYDVFGSDLYGRVELSKENDDWLALFTLTLRIDDGNFSYRVEPGYRQDYIAATDSYEDERSLEVNADWNDGDQFLSDLRLSANAYSQSDISGVSLGYDHAFRYGRIRSQVERIDRNGQKADTFNLNASTSFIITDENLAVGGQQQSQSAVVINLAGELDGVWFDVLVDKRPVAYAIAGTATVVTLRPFETYEVELRARGNGFADVQGDVRSVTLYPGNVVDLSWDVAMVDVVFGQVFLPNGEPVANAVVGGIPGFSVTDEFGLFQAEMTQDTTVLTFQTREFSCTAAVPEYKSRSGVASIGSLQCE